MLLSRRVFHHLPNSELADGRRRCFRLCILLGGVVFEFEDLLYERQVSL